MDWHTLEKMKVTDLRELAKDKLDLTGLTAMHKAELVETIANAMGIEKPHKVAVGAGKSDIKKEIRRLKAKRAEALSVHDPETLIATRHEIHKLKRKLRKMARLVR